MGKLQSIILLGLGLLLNPFTGNAQIGVGLRTGFTLSTFTGVKSWSSANVIPDLGAAVGVVGEFRVLNKDRMAMYVQTELLLLQKGFAVKSGKYTDSYNYDHLVLPVTAKITFGGERFRGFAEFGGYASYVVRAKNVERTNGSKDAVHNISNYQKADAGVILGAGAEFTLGPGALFANLRYDQGLINVATSSFTKWLTATPSMSVGYILRFGKSGGSSNGAGNADTYTTPELEDYSTPETVPDAVQDNSDRTIEQRPAEIDVEPEERRPRQLGIAPQPRVQQAATSSDFSKMIELNKHFDKIAELNASQTDIDISKTEILSRFKHGDVPVIIEIDHVPVDYYSITDFLEYIRINHFRYKITDRHRDDNGLIDQLKIHRIDN